MIISIDHFQSADFFLVEMKFGVDCAADILCIYQNDPTLVMRQSESHFQFFYVHNVWNQNKFIQ